MPTCSPTSRLITPTGTFSFLILRSRATLLCSSPPVTVPFVYYLGRNRLPISTSSSLTFQYQKMLPVQTPRGVLMSADNLLCFVPLTPKGLPNCNMTTNTATLNTLKVIWCDSGYLYASRVFPKKRLCQYIGPYRLLRSLAPVIYMVEPVNLP